MTLVRNRRCSMLVYLRLKPVHTGLYLVRKGEYPDGYPLFVSFYKYKC